MSDHEFKDSGIKQVYILSNDGKEYKQIFKPEEYYKTPKGKYLLVINENSKYYEVYLCEVGIETVEHSEWVYVRKDNLPDFIKTFILLLG